MSRVCACRLCGCCKERQPASKKIIIKHVKKETGKSVIQGSIVASESHAGGRKIDALREGGAGTHETKKGMWGT